MTKVEIKRRAYREAAALLRSDCDAADLLCESDPNVTEDEASQIREFIRREIVGELERKGVP